MQLSHTAKEQQRRGMISETNKHPKRRIIPQIITKQREISNTRLWIWQNLSCIFSLTCSWEHLQRGLPLSQAERRHPTIRRNPYLTCLSTPVHCCRLSLFLRRTPLLSLPYLCLVSQKISPYFPSPSRSSKKPPPPFRSWRPAVKVRNAQPTVYCSMNPVLLTSCALCRSRGRWVSYGRGAVPSENVQVLVRR
jgi:hypothetical protein